MRIIGLDVGSKRIGVAISDETALIAQGCETIERTTPAADFDRIKKLAIDNSASEVVVGLPLNMNGSYSAKTKEVVAFIDELSRVIATPLKTWDERLTTVQAERTMLEADLSRAKRRKSVDKIAAQLILQGYLDARRAGSTQ